ncbi:XRE family transcriptional regulator [Ciceribacter sp. L1K22]|uniref:helix-turn-helix domain-containing protein n=1 Tax=Ciceribacter sp. L1K22 TaxID=2820275 RepID=UPI001FEEC239|nr:XRE family transcriptional regulator [Ciceribacter sp. L1K22]
MQSNTSTTMPLRATAARARKSPVLLDPRRALPDIASILIARPYRAGRAPAIGRAGEGRDGKHPCASIALFTFARAWCNRCWWSPTFAAIVRVRNLRVLREPLLLMMKFGLRAVVTLQFLSFAVFGSIALAYYFVMMFLGRIEEARPIPLYLLAFFGLSLAFSAHELISNRVKYATYLDEKTSLLLRNRRYLLAAGFLVGLALVHRFSTAFSPLSPADVLASFIGLVLAYGLFIDLVSFRFLKWPQPVSASAEAAMAVSVDRSVWDAVADTPHGAANLKLRSALLYEIRKAVLAWNLPTEEAAKRLGLSSARTDVLLAGKLAEFTLDTLVNIAAAAHLEIEVKVRDAA